MAIKYMKRCSTSLIIREMQIKTSMRYYLTLVRMGIIKKSKITNTGEGVEKREPSYTVAIFAISLSLTLKITPKGESESQVIQSCLTLCDPMDGSLPGSSAYGIFQARILEWVAISFSRRSSQPRD